MATSQRMWKREQERRRRERLRRARRRRNCAIVVLLLAAAAVISIIAVNGSGKSEKKSPEPTQREQTAQTDKNVITNPYTTTRTADDIKASFFDDSAFAGNALAATIGMYGVTEGADFYSDVNLTLENVYETTSAGSTTTIAEQFKSKRFDKIFLAFGENELSTMTSGEFKTAYKKLIGKIEGYQPNARIYLIGIPPVTADVSSSNDNINMEKIEEFNKRIISIAADKEIYYIDAVEALGDNKDFLPSGVSADGINLNRAAVIDLLYYTSKKAYIPDEDDLARIGEAEETDDENAENDEPKASEKPKTTAAPKASAAPSQSAKATATPAPTVNILKDSVGDKKTKKE